MRVNVLIASVGSVGCVNVLIYWDRSQIEELSSYQKTWEGFTSFRKNKIVTKVIMAEIPIMKNKQLSVDDSLTEIHSKLNLFMVMSSIMLLIIIIMIIILTVIVIIYALIPIHNLSNSLNDTQNSLSAKVDQAREELSAAIADVKQDIADVKQDVGDAIADIKQDIEDVICFLIPSRCNG